MIKVAALTSGRNVPGSRFRVRQFIRPLARHGVLVSEYWPIIDKFTPSPRWARAAVNQVKSMTRLPGILAARRSDVTWLQREFVPGVRSLERLAGARRIFDVDDAIWLTGSRPFSEEIVADCFGVIAGNQFIADHYRPVAKRIWVVPTSVDTAAWQPAVSRPTGRWTVGWMGTSSNLEYLLQLEPPLAEFLSRFAEAELLVVCDRRPRFRRLPRGRLRFVRWSPSVELAMAQQMNVGLMPLPKTEWALGKCAFKMLLYLAVGVPVVASPVGVCELLLRSDTVGLAASTDAEWHDALARLFEDRGFAAGAGAAGRRLVEERYSVARNVVPLADIFREAAA